MIIDVFSKPEFVNIRMFKTILQFYDNENKKSENYFGSNTVFLFLFFSADVEEFY